jgi:o-succinylbenzoate synthase
VPIIAVRTHRVRVPLHTPFVTALRRTTTAESLIVEITDDEGRSGYGEAPQIWQVTGDSIAGSQSCVDDMLGPLLVGKDPDDLVARCREVARAVVENHSAKAAVDVALHDLAARRMNISLVRLLGGSATSVPTDITLAAGEPEGLAEAAATRIGEGFGVLKLKVGTDAAGDLARIRAVRAAAPAATIRLDANQGWSPRDAVRVIRAVEDADLGIEFVEQPVVKWDLEGLAWVSDRVETPIMADEAVFGIRDLTEVIRRHAADLVNVKLAKCGGLLPARTMIELARAHGLGVIVGSMMETQVGVGAAAALVAAPVAAAGALVAVVPPQAARRAAMAEAEKPSAAARLTKSRRLSSPAVSRRIRSRGSRGCEDMSMLPY